MEDENGTVIDDLGKYLNQNYVSKDALDGNSSPFYVYVYKRLNPKDNKAYTEVCPKIVQNTNKNQEDLKSYIKFMKSKGYIKEHTEDGETISSKPVASTPF